MIYHLFLFQGKNVVRRYDLPGIHGLNFVLEAALGGGGIASLRPDPQGNAKIPFLLLSYIYFI